MLKYLYLNNNSKLPKKGDNMDEFPLLCPICRGALNKADKSCICERRHCFDISKYGYVNLLPPSGKGAHGDNREMIKARKDFLDRGYYTPLRLALAKKVKAFCNDRRVLVLDAGCGEGYYSEQIERDNPFSRIVGVDISKEALIYASKRLKAPCLAAASIHNLPLNSNEFDVVLNIFAPFDKDEYLRVMKSNGRLYMVIPGREHLFELKEKLYEKPYKNTLAPFETDKLRLISKENITYKMNIASNADLQNLFKMTPYSHRTSFENIRSLEGIDSLSITADFIILEYAKADNKAAQA